MNKKVEMSGILVLILLVGAFFAGHYIWKSNIQPQSLHYEFYTAFPHPIDSPGFNQAEVNRLCSATSDPSYTCTGSIYEPYNFNSPDVNSRVCYARCSLSDGSIHGDFWLVRCSCYK